MEARRFLRQGAKLVAKLVLLLITASIVWLYATPSGHQWRLLAADSLLTTRHGEWAIIFVGQRGVKQRKQYYEMQFDRMGAHRSSSIDIHVKPRPDTQSLIRVEPIQGKPYEGFLLYVADPHKLRLAIPDQEGYGETLSSMAKRTGALAAVNAGGFLDPEHMGDGAVPVGIVVTGGQLLYNSEDGDTPSHIVGITSSGTLIAGKYRPSELPELDIQEAVTFAPRLIQDGKGLIEDSRDGWGIAPRTAIAQLEDGTIVFAIIDGRQVHSIGATLYDVQQLFLEIGALTAANLDGGASTELFAEGAVLNKPATKLGERPIPTGWIVLQEPQNYKPLNPWSHIDPRIIKKSR